MKNILFVGLGLLLLNTTQAHAVGVVDQSKYTCQVLNDYLDKKGSFYVNSIFGPVLLDKVGCSNSQLQSPLCKNISDYVTAKDGPCHIGVACHCEKEHGNHGNGGHQGGGHGGGGGEHQGGGHTNGGPSGGHEKPD